MPGSRRVRGWAPVAGREGRAAEMAAGTEWLPGVVGLPSVIGPLAMNGAVGQVNPGPLGRLPGLALLVFSNPRLFLLEQHREA